MNLKQGEAFSNQVNMMLPKKTPGKNVYYRKNKRILSRDQDAGFDSAVISAGILCPGLAFAIQEGHCPLL